MLKVRIHIQSEVINNGDGTETVWLRTSRGGQWGEWERHQTVGFVLPHGRILDTPDEFGWPPVANCA